MRSTIGLLRRGASDCGLEASADASAQTGDQGSSRKAASQAGTVATPVEVPKPKVYNPVVATVVKPVTRKPTTAPEQVEVAKAFPDPNPPMSMGSSALPTLKKPREAVQTGGFGDPDGVKANNVTNKNPNINAAGGFDMPNGPGEGNGTGGAKGAKGVVAARDLVMVLQLAGPGGGSQRHRADRRLR